MDPITILAGIKTGMAAGKTIAGLSKEIGNSLTQQTQPKSNYRKKVYPKKRKRYSDGQVGFFEGCC